MCRAHFPAFKPRASCSFVAFFTFLLVMESGVAAPAPVAKSKPKAEQTIELGNVGEKATVNIKQVQGVAPEDHKLVIGLLASYEKPAKQPLAVCWIKPARKRRTTLPCAPDKPC